MYRRITLLRSGGKLANGDRGARLACAIFAKLCVLYCQVRKEQECASIRTPSRNGNGGLDVRLVYTLDACERRA